MTEEVRTKFANPVRPALSLEWAMEERIVVTLLERRVKVEERSPVSG